MCLSQGTSVGGTWVMDLPGWAAGIVTCLDLVSVSVGRWEL